MNAIWGSKARVAGAVAATMLTGIAFAAPAQAATPDHATQQPKCTSWAAGNPGQVQVYFPLYVSRALSTSTYEKVAYSADLYRWNGSSWALWYSGKPWVWFSVDRNGYPIAQQQYPGYPTSQYNPNAIYWELTNGQALTTQGPYTESLDLGVYEDKPLNGDFLRREPTNSFIFNGTPTGYYAIKHYLYWYATGTQTSEWSTYCQVGNLDF